MSDSKYFLFALLAVAAAGCQSEARGERAKLPYQPPPSALPQAQLAAVEKTGDNRATASAPDDDKVDSGGVIRLTGSTAPHRSSAVAANGSGLLEKMLVREGDMVKSGQAIALLDRSDAELRVRQAQAGLEGARVGLAAAQRERKRLQQLDQGAAVSQAQIDQAQTALEGAQANLTAAEVALAMAEDVRNNRTVRSPYSGLVVARLKSEGEWITTMPPSPVVQLVEIAPLDLQIEAPENLLTRVRIGDRVTAQFKWINRTVEAKVSRIVPLVQAGSRSFKVISELPNEDYAIQPGVFAEVEITPGADAVSAKGASKSRSFRSAR